MELKWDTRDGVWIVRLGGKLDISSTENLEQLIKDKLTAEPRPLVINLSQVTYISSSGLGVLLGLYRFMGEKRLSLTLCEVAPPVQKLLDVIDLGQVFVILPGEAEAIQSAIPK
jgi:anti-anti-sigma factor